MSGNKLARHLDLPEDVGKLITQFTASTRRHPRPVFGNVMDLPPAEVHCRVRGCRNAPVMARQYWRRKGKRGFPDPEIVQFVCSEHLPEVDSGEWQMLLF